MSHSSATMNKESSKVTGKNLDSNQSRDDCPTFSSNLSETWLVVGPFLCLTLMSKAAQTNTLNIIDHFSFATVNICLIKLFFLPAPKSTAATTTNRHLKSSKMIQPINLPIIIPFLYSNKDAQSRKVVRGSF